MKASVSGYSKACYQIGRIYAEGLGVPRDYKEAYDMFSDAAEHGLAQAQYRLGKLYQNGLGVTKDHSRACLWLQKAAK